MEKAEIIGTIIRIAAAASMSYLTVRYLVKYMDPNHKSNEENRKKVAQILEELQITHEINLNDHELKIATQFVSAVDDLGVSWDDIGGYNDLVSDLISRMILPLEYAQVSSSSLLSPPKGILLYGPPGCGKTLLAKALARAAGCRFQIYIIMGRFMFRFLNLQVSDLTDKWYGESQKLAAAVFSVAQKFQPTIIFIDEIDSFLRDRQTHDHEATAMMKAQFMTLWDGFCSSSDQIIVMGATNRPRDVDPAFLRRMPAKFHVPYPNETQRAKILEVILKKENIDLNVNLEDVAKSTDGLSGSDLKEICRLAMLSRAEATIRSGGSLASINPLEQEDFNKAIEKYMGADQILLNDKFQCGISLD